VEFERKLAEKGTILKLTLDAAVSPERAAVAGTWQRADASP
jgi:hypothetical protein